MKVGKIMLGMCQTNCYYLYEEGSKEAVFVDPADQGAYLYEQVQKAGLQIVGILLTHGHFDHIWGANELRKLSGAKIYAQDVEKALFVKMLKQICPHSVADRDRDSGRLCKGWRGDHTGRYDGKGDRNTGAYRRKLLLLLRKR